jgi:predicted permease
LLTVRVTVFGFMTLSVILISVFRLAASHSARRSFLEPLRFAVMGFLTLTFLCGIETTLLLAIPLHARLSLEPLTQPLIRTWYVKRTTPSHALAHDL